ncbi:MAG TPA: RNA 2',3'-cyclic phosphodiesterase [Allosphingosinicella sp.]|jgi:2'-5' RNA ligase|nr:RNA 2',3'-cyclic phosphodiesterase [Allosphingosinicella sp.]
MHRLFVAIRLPPPVRARLLGLMGGVAGARWQSEDQLHLTLRFIGEVDRHQALDVDAALSGVHNPAFTIALSGLGVFDRRGEPVTLWAGLAPQEPLRALHRKVDQALVRAGLEPERRAYLPHVTLARLPRGAGPVGPLIEGSGGLAGPGFEVRDFRLYESRLTPEGPVYTPVETYSLA